MTADKPSNPRPPVNEPPGNDDSKGQVIHATPKPGGRQADKSKGKGDDEIDQAAVSGREPSGGAANDNPTDPLPPIKEPPKDDTAGGPLPNVKEPIPDPNKIARKRSDDPIGGDNVPDALQNLNSV